MGLEVQYFGMEHKGRCVGNRVNAYTSDMDFHGGYKLSKLTYPIKTIYSKESLDWLGKAPHRGTRCPRCGEKAQPGNRLLALSRRADIHVCELCGMQESLVDAGFLERKPLTDWAIVRKGWGE